MSVAAPEAPPVVEETPAGREPLSSTDPPGLRLLDRFLWLVAKDVDGDAILAVKYTPEELERLKSLERLDRTGKLPQEDEVELQAFRDVAQFSGMMKATVDRIRNGWTGPTV